MYHNVRVTGNSSLGQPRRARPSFALTPALPDGPSRVVLSSPARGEFKFRTAAALEFKSPFSIHIISELDGTSLIARSESMNWTQLATDPKLLALVRGLRLETETRKAACQRKASCF